MTFHVFSLALHFHLWLHMTNLLGSAKEDMKPSQPEGDFLTASLHKAMVLSDQLHCHLTSLPSISMRKRVSSGVEEVVSSHGTALSDAEAVNLSPLAKTDPCNRTAGMICKYRGVGLQPRWWDYWMALLIIFWGIK